VLLLCRALLVHAQCQQTDVICCFWLLLLLLQRC
jgi:hypothetical protein